MRKASMNFKSGALYTKDGRKLADIDSGVAGTTIRNSTWADRIRERFMRVV